jgi:hypothetical protein
MELLSSSSITCVLDVRGREVHLSVRQEGADIWRWKIQFDKGILLEEGLATTRIAAQVEAQRAFEYRLQRAGVDYFGFTGYRWNEVVG